MTADLLFAVSAVGEAQAQSAKLVDVSVRVSFTASLTQSGFMIAKEKGWYEQAGLNVKIGEGTGSTSTAQLIAAGQDTFGYINADVLLRRVASGVPLKMVSMPVTDSAYGIVCRGDRGITKPQDLAGHGYFDSAFSTSYVLFPLFFKNAGVPADKVNVQQVTASALVPGIMAGQFDCIGAVESQVTQYIIDGRAPIFFRYSDYGVPQDGLGIIVNDSYLVSNPEIVRKFVEISNRGFAWALEHPDEVYAILKKQFPNYSYAESVTANGTRTLAEQAARLPKGAPFGRIDDTMMDRLTTMLEKDFGMAQLSDPKRAYTNDYIAKQP